jgi:hypothetical protein
VLGRVKHPAKIVIFNGETLNVLHKAFHNISSFGIMSISAYDSNEAGYST